MARYYTRTGDTGETSLYTGERVRKDSLRVNSYGDVDELQAFMGYARAIVGDEEVAADLESIESTLVSVMTQLASTDGVIRVGESDVAAIEAACDKYTERIEAGKFSFVLPGESAASAALHVARAVARRVERRVVTFAEAEPVDAELIKYLNRVSDLLFAMAVYRGSR